MQDEKNTLEPHPNGFLLRQTDSAGHTSEIILTEKSVPSLAQSSLRLRANILAKYSRGETDAVATSFVSRVGLGTDVHKSQVFLTLYDTQDVPTVFAVPLEVAKPLSERLPVKVAEIEAAIPNITKQ
jgi:hypothetical protein